MTTPALLAPPVAWLAVFFLAPVVYVALYSFNVLALPPQATGFSVSAWHALIHGGVYLSLFWKSVQMSLAVSALVVVVAYPLLGDHGVVNTFLSWVGLRSAEHPLSFLLYSRFAVMLVLGYVWLPFVALPIFVTLESLDRKLLEAASDLYASRLQAFVRVTLPLSMSGVIAAFLFVFIPTVGEFVTPSLVGGTSGYMYGNQIHDLFNSGFPDWQIGATLSLFLLGVIAALTLVFIRFLRVSEARAV